MTPWMPDGNITQYIQMNPDANRLILVRTINSKIGAGNLLSVPTVACASVPGPDAPSRTGHFTRQCHSGKHIEEIEMSDVR